MRVLSLTNSRRSRSMANWSDIPFSLFDASFAASDVISLADVSDVCN